MATTTLGIVYPVVGDTLTPLASHFAALASSADTAISNSNKTNGTPPVADATARDALFPSPVQGNSVYRLDKGWMERYYALYNSTTNPGGASTAGWYPVSGRMPYATARGTATLSATNNAWSIGSVGFTAGGFEHGGFTSSGASNYYLNVPYPGLYDIQVYASFSSNANGNLRSVRAVLDNATVTPTIYQTPRHAVQSSSYGVQSQFMSMAVATNIQLQIFQDSGAGLNTVDRVLTARYLGPVGVIQNAV
jgi:hypothetical protein